MYASFALKVSKIESIYTFVILGGFFLNTLIDLNSLEVAISPKLINIENVAEKKIFMKHFSSPDKKKE